MQVGSDEEHNDLVSCSGENDVKKAARDWEWLGLGAHEFAFPEDDDCCVGFAALGLVEVHQLNFVWGVRRLRQSRVTGLTSLGTYCGDFARSICEPPPSFGPDAL